MIRQFGKAFVGGSSYWFRSPPWVAVLVIPLAIGLVRLFRKRDFRPLLLFSLLYIAAFVLAARDYASNFPWYFVPHLAAAYLATGAGIAWLFQKIARGSSAWRMLLLVASAAIWVAVSMPSLERNVDLLNRKAVMRERAYAIVTVWLGRELGGKATIAANEIGSIGFYSRTGTSVLDMFGLLRDRADLRKSFVDLVRERSPEAIVTRETFSYRGRLEADLPGAYRWSKYGDVDVGLRADLAPAVMEKADDLRACESAVDMRREYRW